MSDSNFVQAMTVHTTDFEELQDSAADWDQQISQLVPGAFEGTMDLRVSGNR